jgi:transcriptional regulator with XRE-family HTH domain
LLTPQQLEALELLSQGHTQQATADKIGASRRTITRWLKDEEFSQALQGIKGAQFVVNPEILPVSDSPSAIWRKLNSLVPTVIREVEAILTNPDTRTADKLKAAQLLAKWSGLEDKMDVDTSIRYLAENGAISPEAIDFVMESLNTYMESLANILRGDFEPNKNFESSKTHQSAISRN